MLPRSHRRHPLRRPPGKSPAKPRRRAPRRLRRPARHPWARLANPRPRKPPPFAQPAGPTSWRIAPAFNRAGPRPFNACRATRRSSRSRAGLRLRRSAAARLRVRRRHRQRPRLRPPRRFGHEDSFRSKIAWRFFGFAALTSLRSAPERRQAAAKSSTVSPQMHAASRRTATQRSPASAGKTRRELRNRDASDACRALACFGRLSHFGLAF